MGTIVPAVLPSSRDDLEAKLELFARMPSVDRVQIDVVDGQYAEPASWPYTEPGTLGILQSHGEALPRLETIAYEIDLMCLDALEAAGEWLALGASRLTFHARTPAEVPQLVAAAHRRYGGDFIAEPFVSFGVALGIGEDAAPLDACLDNIDYVQFMGIASIGRQGEPFDARVFDAIKTFHAAHPDMPIQVDGGISSANAKRLLALGVSNLIVGSAILDAPDPRATFIELENLSSPYGV